MDEKIIAKLLAELKQTFKEYCIEIKIINKFLYEIIVKTDYERILLDFPYKYFKNQSFDTNFKRLILEICKKCV